MTQEMNRRRGDSANRWRGLVLAVAMLGVAVLTVPAVAQAGAPGGLQEKLAAVKQSIAENQQRLHQYKWVETTQLTLKGDAKPPSQSMCMYGPDGTVQKTPMSAPPPPPSGRRLKQKIIADKTADIKDYMGQVKTLLGLYVPPDPQKMQAAFEAKKAMLGDGTLVFTDYALPGDKMTVSFDPGAKKITGLNVNTYMDDPKDVVTLAVQFSSLPDGTNYAVQTVLNATAKQLVVTTTNSNYTPVGQ
jgi:hypothetical protein